MATSKETLEGIVFRHNKHPYREDSEITLKIEECEAFTEGQKALRAILSGDKLMFKDVLEFSDVADMEKYTEELCERILNKFYELGCKALNGISQE